MIKNKETFLGIICLGTVGVILLAGLWPLNFWPKNEVEFLKGKNGIRFYGRGIAYTPRPLWGQESNSPHTGSISLEIWLEPESEIDHHLAHILVLYDGNKSQDIVIGQWKTSLIVRSRSLNTGHPTYREVSIRDVLHHGESHLLTFVSRNEETTVYIDGKWKRTFPGYTVLNHRSGSKHLVLGNSPTGRHDWLGTLFGLAVYNLPLTEQEIDQHYQAWIQGQYDRLSEQKGLHAIYSFNEQSGTWVHNHAGSRVDLMIPATLHILQKSILNSSWKDVGLSRSSFKDIVINVAGFLPTGFFALFYLRSKKIPFAVAYLTAVVLGVALSLLVELLQVYLPGRTSSLTDLMCNGLGTALGAIGSAFVRKNVVSSRF